MARALTFLLVLGIIFGYPVSPNVWIIDNEPNIRPFDDTRMSNRFILNKIIVGKYDEVRTHPVTNHEYLHKGIDYALTKNTPILATGGGIVMFAEWCEGYGNLLMIDHGNDVITMYAHLQRYNVLQGSKIDRGDVLGFVGSTGMSQGHHVHWELRIKGKAVFAGRFINRRRERERRN